MSDIGDDPRFHAALALLDGGDSVEAADEFEELFFEAVRDEVEFSRVFLQLAAGAIHVERRQCRAAAQRLDECVRAIGRVGNDRGYDLEGLAAELRSLIARLQGGESGVFPRVRRR